jgi:hypothetical protein
MKTDPCPFSKSRCTECAIYRGRHQYMAFSGEHQGCANGPDDHIAAYFQAVEECLDPWADSGVRMINEPRIRLRVVDVESGETKICEFNETKTWDWDNPEMMRLVDGRQVKSFDNLMDIVCYKAEKGYEEVKIYEAPRFMILAGG